MSVTSKPATSSTGSNLTLNEPPSAAASAESVDFKIGERVYVNGTKPGELAFLGEAKFKEGLWAGVILDAAEGKNNGTVAGTTYFQTDENRGVFCRPNKLSRVYDASLSAAAGPEQTSTAPAAAAVTNDYGIKVGDRVIIESTGTAKLGILRYLGTTDFAKGDWAGVELDDRIGKNDGSVAAKRYFQCEPMYGLFAPVQKVHLYTGQLESISETRAVKQVAATPMPGRPITRLPSSLNKTSRKLSASQESITSEKSSIYSTASGAVNKQHVPPPPPAAAVNAHTTPIGVQKKLSTLKTVQKS
jgi:CAP-Gly domain-containing linker protein 1